MTTEDDDDDDDVKNDTDVSDFLWKILKFLQIIDFM